MRQTETIYRNVGRRLRAVREGLGFSQVEVARKLGMSDVAYHNYEVGARRIPLSELSRVSDFYGKPASYFLGEDLTPEQLASWELGSLSEDDKRMVADLVAFLRDRNARQNPNAA